MSIRAGSTRVARQIVRHFEIPEFLCPILRNRSTFQRELPSCRHQILRSPRQRFVHAETSTSNEKSAVVNAYNGQRKLPQQCPGCGAFSQTIGKEEPGFYSLSRKSVKEYLGDRQAQKASEEEEIIKASLQNVDGEIAESLGLDKPASCKNEKLNPQRKPH